MTNKLETQGITLSTTAAEVVRKMLKKRKLNDTYALRIYITGRTCSGFQYGMAFDNKNQAKDIIYESEGLRIIVDNESMIHISGSRVDYIDDDRGSGFLVDNPNQAPSCSCETGTCGY